MRKEIWLSLLLALPLAACNEGGNSNESMTDNSSEVAASANQPSDKQQSITGMAGSASDAAVSNSENPAASDNNDATAVTPSDNTSMNPSDNETDETNNPMSSSTSTEANTVDNEQNTQQDNSSQSMNNGAQQSSLTANAPQYAENTMQSPVGTPDVTATDSDMQAGSMNSPVASEANPNAAMTDTTVSDYSLDNTAQMTQQPASQPEQQSQQDTDMLQSVPQQQQSQQDTDMSQSVPQPTVGQADDATVPNTGTTITTNPNSSMDANGQKNNNTNQETSGSRKIVIPSA